jgi:hypothetical protein
MKPADYVAEANEALASMRSSGARWWHYLVSHCTFELIIGDPSGKDNLVLSLSACERLAGPIEWPNQQIHVNLEFEPDHLGGNRKYTLQDDSEAFSAVARVFRWARNYDIFAYSGLYIRREGEGPPMKPEEFLQLAEAKFQQYFKGETSFDDLRRDMDVALWYRLPVVRSGGTAAGHDQRRP